MSSLEDAAGWDCVPDPEILRHRARLCREQATVATQPRLAEAFIGLADALEFAACVAELVVLRVSH
jgi:hypothetical protein